MASKIASPWRSVRSLAVRTRPSRPPHRHHVLQTASRPPLPAATRGLANDASLYPPFGDAADFPPPESESESTPEPRAPRPLKPFADNFMNAEAVAALEQAVAGEDVVTLAAEGLKFGMPAPAAKHEQLQDRQHPVIHQITRMLMRDGKLSKAQKHVSLILNYLRTSPPPRVSPLRPLLPGSPPPEELPLNPLLYLTLAIDSVAPIVRVRSLKGMAGGGNALEVPEPIDSRTRRRQAIIWILDNVNKKRSTGSGPKQFAARFGQEIISVIEGRSSVWDRRQVLHKLGTAARANLAHPRLSFKKK
ncbi:ribosomal protein S7 domain-containing protein [Xylaria sp. FL1777]|nr:ribosomal protein S7 domain-containing protein [Xylaria sp. FL1777]